MNELGHETTGYETTGYEMDTHGTGFGMGAFLIGAAVGAATALMLAPAKGNDTRAYLKRRGGDFARDAVRRSRDTWRAQSGRMKSAISSGWESAEQTMGEVSEQVRSAQQQATQPRPSVDRPLSERAVR